MNQPVRSQKPAASPVGAQRAQSVADMLMAHMGRRPETYADLIYNSLSGIGGALAQRGADKQRAEYEAEQSAVFQELMKNQGLDEKQMALYGAIGSNPEGRQSVTDMLMQRDMLANAPMTPHQRAQLAQGDRRIGLDESQFDFDKRYKTDRASVADELARGQLGVSQGRLALDRDRLALDARKLDAKPSTATEFDKYSQRVAAGQLPKIEQELQQVNDTLAALNKLEGLANDPDTDFGPYSGIGDIGRNIANTLTGGYAYSESLANNRNFDSTKGDLVLDAMSAIKGAASDRDAALAASVETDRTELRETSQRKLAAKRVLIDATRTLLTEKLRMIQANRGPITAEQQAQLNAQLDIASDKAREVLRGGAEPGKMSDDELLQSVGDLLKQSEQ